MFFPNHPPLRRSLFGRNLETEIAVSMMQMSSKRVRRLGQVYLVGRIQVVRHGAAFFTGFRAVFTTSAIDLVATRFICCFLH